jgi:uncharacterized membrane protein
MTYFSLWTIVFFYLNLKISENYFTRLYSLKIENQWQVGTQHIISIDTEVSRLKHTFMLPKKWFLLPLIILIVPIVNNVFEEQEGLLWAHIVTGFIIWALFFFIYFGIGKMQTKTYSETTAINLHLNHVFKSQWSKCMIFLATLMSLFFVVVLYAPEIQNIAIIILSLAMIVIIVLPHNKIRAVRNRLLRIEDEDLDRNDDQYWISGVLYNNPNDRSVFVEKRLGIGMTMNIGTLGGKMIFAGVFLLVIYAIVSIVWVILGS